MCGWLLAFAVHSCGHTVGHIPIALLRAVWSDATGRLADGDSSARMDTLFLQNSLRVLHAGDHSCTYQHADCHDERHLPEDTGKILCYYEF